MVQLKLSPYVHFIENRLVPNTVQYRIFHQLTGDVFELSEWLRSLMLAVRLANTISLCEEDFDKFGEASAQIRRLIEGEFLIPEDRDPLARFVDQYVVRPMQNPAVAYHSKEGEILLVRTSMAHYLFSPKRGELPTVIEEILPPVIAHLFLLADGTRTLRQIFELLKPNGANVLEEASFRHSVDFLTSPDRQLIKLTAGCENLSDPYKPFNIVPRSLYHSARWDQPANNAKPTIGFHRLGIEDASWEFDWIEPTINHSFRFPTEVLGGLDYGARFCLSALRPEVLPRLGDSHRLQLLEVGGGTGTFARSFIEQTSSLLKRTALNYQILELSPVLIENQRKLLSKFQPAITHFQQDATELDLHGHRFDLIIANEVVADFPIASVRRAPVIESGDKRGDGSANYGQRWEGDGAHYIEKYQLPQNDAPDTFLVNAGVFEFIERAWKHISPGGTLIVSEYGSEHKYPVQAYHLNHEEFSIHFGHVAACARKVGFNCNLLTLKEFLAVDDEALMFNGRGEHLLCLNHVLKKHNISLPYAAISKKEFQERVQGVAERIGLVGFSFSPLRTAWHYGPDLKEFMVLIMNKPMRFEREPVAKVMSETS